VVLNKLEKPFTVEGRMNGGQVRGIVEDGFSNVFQAFRHVPTLKEIDDSKKVDFLLVTRECTSSVLPKQWNSCRFRFIATSHQRLNFQFRFWSDVVHSNQKRVVHHFMAHQKLCSSKKEKQKSNNEQKKHKHNNKPLHLFQVLPEECSCNSLASQFCPS
jgi:hypothetical protein